MALNAPRSRTIVLTDAGTAAFTVALAEYDGTVSNATPTPAPVFTTPSSIATDGTPQVGEQLTGIDGVATDTSSYTRRWLLGSTVLTSSATYTPSAVGTYRYETIATGPGGEKTSGSNITVAAATPAPAPSLSLSSAVVKAEGNSGTTLYSWTLTLNRDGSTAAFPFTWSTTGSGANPANAADFGGTFPTGSGTFAVGETSKTISVLASGDTAFETDETFTLTVAATGLNTVTSTGTLTNDDTAPVTPTVAISAAQSKSEGNSGANLFTYTVTRSATSGAVNVPWTFAAGGTSADDFTGGALPTGGTVAMADGVATGTFAISVNGDTAVESDETFTVSIAAPSGYALGSVTSATGLIVNDDSSGPPLPASIQIVPEGDSLTAYTNTNGRPGWADQAVVGLISGPTYMYRKVAQGGETAQAMDDDFNKGTPPAAIVPGSGSFGSIGTSKGPGPAYDPSFAMNIMMLGPVGTNDDISQNSIAVYKSIRSIVNKSYAKGYDRTLVSTLISRNGVAGDSTDTYVGHNYDANNIQINRDISALWDSDIGADYLLDFATIWPTQASYTVPDQAADGTHQSGTGFDKMAVPARAGLNAVIQSPGVKKMEPLTWSPWDGRSEVALSDANRTITATVGSAGYFRYAYPNLRSGKWYFEIDVTTGTNTAVGISTRGTKLAANGATLVTTANGYIEVNQAGAVTIVGASAPVAQLGARSVGDVICFALDADNHRLWVRRNALAWNGDSEAFVSTDPALQKGYIDISALRAFDIAASGRAAAYSPFLRSFAAMTAVTRLAAAEHVRRRPTTYQALDLGTAQIAAVVPTNLTIPVISGEAVVGKTLTASGDTWDNSPTSYTNAWTRNGVAISGATGRTYTVVAADVGQNIGYSRTPINSAGAGSPAVAVSTYPAYAAADAWSPLILGTKMFAWWKPSAAAITGTGTATRWAEEKGNAAPANQTFSGTAPGPVFSATARNGTPGAQIGGSGTLASNVAENNFIYPRNTTSPLFMAVSAFMPAGSAERAVFTLGDGVATRALGIGADATGVVEIVGGNATAFKPASGKTWSDQDRMVSVSYPGNGAGTTMTIDGVTEAVAIPDRTSGTARYRLGGDSSGTGSARYFNGIIQNIYLLSPLPTLIEQQKLEGYDSWITGKAGANLPSGHPYKSRAPLAGDAS